jgi:hypothetical protein
MSATEVRAADPRVTALIQLAGIQSEGYDLFDAARAILLHVSYREVDEFWRHVTEAVAYADGFDCGGHDDEHPDLWSIPRELRGERADELKEQMLADVARYCKEMVRPPRPGHRERSMSTLTPEQQQSREKSLTYAKALAAAYDAGDGQHLHDLIHTRSDEVSVFLDLLSAISQLSQQVEESRA